MKISGILLKQAVEFLNQARSNTQAYSRFIELTFMGEGSIMTKVCGDVIVAASCLYFDHEYKTDEPDKLETPHVAIIPIDRLTKYLKHNTGVIDIAISSNSILLSGKGNLKLAFADPDEYELCEFDHFNYFWGGWTENASVVITEESEIETLIDKFKSLSRWADTTTPSPIFRNVFFDTGKASARLYKTNTSVLDVSLGIPLSCYGLIDVNFLQIMSRLKGIKKLALVVPKSEEEGNLTAFVATNTDIPMTYVCVGRLSAGVHPVKEINDTIALIVKQGKYFECQRTDLLGLIQRSLGYVDGVQIGVFTFRDQQMTIQVKQANDVYTDAISVDVNTLNSFFRLNLQALERILVDMDDEVVRMYAYTEEGVVTKFAIVTSNESKRGYLFPAV